MCCGNSFAFIKFYRIKTVFCHAGKKFIYSVEFNRSKLAKEQKQLDKSRIFQELHAADWENIGKEMLSFALWWASRYRWSSGSPEILPLGNELADVVQRIILQTINGERNWDPDKGELLPWLKDQTKSVIDALAKSASHRKENPIFSEEDDGLSDRKEMIALEINPSENQDRMSPEEFIICQENEQERRDRALYKYSALFCAIEGDTELEEILEAVIDGVDLKARLLAGKLEVPVEDIYNRLKRLKRKAMSIKEKE